MQLYSHAATALIAGDCVHHPVQMLHPGIDSCADVDPVQAADTRHGLLASLADTDTLMLGTHFPAPTGGLVVSEGGSYRFASVPASPTGDLPARG